MDLEDQEARDRIAHIFGVGRRLVSLCWDGGDELSPPQPSRIIDVTIARRFRPHRSAWEKLVAAGLPIVSYAEASIVWANMQEPVGEGPIKFEDVERPGEPQGAPAAVEVLEAHPHLREPLDEAELARIVPLLPSAEMILRHMAAEAGQEVWMDPGADLVLSALLREWARRNVSLGSPEDRELEGP
jgi:hypothetical protein